MKHTVLRHLLVILAISAAWAGFAQSTGFAMSWWYAESVSYLTPLGPDHIWTPVPLPFWEQEKDHFFAMAGGWDTEVPWMFLTDWFWLLLIAPGCALLQSLVLPSQRPTHRVLTLLACTLVSALGWGGYAVVFVWGTNYPIAIAQRELGWIFAGLTILLALLGTTVCLSAARRVLRRVCSAILNRRALTEMSGLWVSDGLAAPDGEAASKSCD